MLRQKGAWATPRSTVRRGRHHPFGGIRRLRLPQISFAGAEERQRGRQASAHTLRRRSRARWVVIGGALVVLIYFIAMAASLYLARSAMLDGAATLRTTQAGLSLARVQKSPLGALNQVTPALTQAQADFERAQSRLAPFAPVLRRLGWVPGVGRDLAEAPLAARLGAETTAGASGLVAAVKPALSGDQSGHASIGSLLHRVDSARPTITGACSSFTAATTTRAQIGDHPSARLAGPLRTFDHDLPGLLTLCRALAAVPGLLGADGPASYLVAYQNPSQIRAAGGFLGSAGLLTVTNGNVHQRFIGTWIEDKLTYQPPLAIGQEDGEPAWLFRDSNWSPNFPTSAALERFFARLDLGWKVDGVIDITPQAVAAALGALGPVYVPEYSRWVNAGNIASLADFYAHRTDNTGPLRTGSPDTQRKQFFSIVAQHLFARLHTLKPGTMVRLAHSLDAAVRHGDLLINFTNARDQWLVDRIGASGRVNPTRSDYLYVTDSNISYNKINPYIRESMRYRASVLPNRWVQSDLTLTYTDVPAPKYIYADSYGPGAGKTGAPADYGDFVRVLVPNGARLVDQSGWLHPYTSGSAYGKTMFSGYLIVRKGETRRVHLRYLMPPNVFAPTAGNRYRLLVQHQPGSHPVAARVTVTADGSTRSWTKSHPDSDWSVSQPIQHRPFTPIALPANPFPTVKLGQWLEPGTYLGLRK